MTLESLVAEPELRTIAKLVEAADCTLVPATIGRGVDSHGLPIIGLEERLIQSLGDVVTAGKLAEQMLARVKRSG